MATRIYVDQALELSSDVVLPIEAAHHVVRVLRMRVGENIRLFNGVGGEFLGSLVVIEKTRVTVELKEFMPDNCVSPLNVVLAQGISRGDRMDYTLQKAVELGITEIVPIECQRSTVRLDDERAEKKREHWNKIIISACEQCGQNIIPKLAKVTNFDNFLSSPLEGEQLILSPSANQHNRLTSEMPARIYLLVGPEGGFDEREIKQAHDCGFKSLTLGPRILRTETAALVALSVLQAKWGDIKI